MSKSKRLEIKVKGKTFWYDQEQEKVIIKFMEEKKKMFNLVFSEPYGQARKDMYTKYPAYYGTYPRKMLLLL